MYYVSAFDKQNNTWGITDTSDGVTEFYSKEFILANFKKIKIDGVSGSSIKVVNAATKVANQHFDKFEAILRSKIDTWDYDTCYEVARKGSFARQVKGIENINEVHRIVMEHIYPQNIRDAVAQASDYSNELIEVNCTDRNAIINALRNNVCLVLQQKTNGVLTSFICTGSLNVTDKIYQPGFFDSVYLTRQLYSYTANYSKLRPQNQDKKPKNPDLLNVFSCALRFRRDGVHHDGMMKVLSNPFYSVNIPKVLGMFILKNPSKLGDRILPEFHMTGNKEGYDFNFNMWQEIQGCLEDGTNYFGNRDKFMTYVEGSNDKVSIDDAITRFQADFDYMEYLRLNGYSFKAN